MKGVYTYQYLKAARPQKVFERASVNVELLAQTATQYKVKYLGFHANGAPVGHITFVRKDRVTVDHGEAARTLQHIKREKKPKPKGGPNWLPYKD